MNKFSHKSIMLFIKKLKKEKIPNFNKIDILANNLYF
jgi:hypothetical protein